MLNTMPRAPRTDKLDRTINIQVDEELYARIDAWRISQIEPLSRTMAVRWLVRMGLRAAGAHAVGTPPVDPPATVPQT